MGGASTGRGLAGRRPGWPLIATIPLLLAAGLLAAAQTLPLRAGDGPETFCDRARASFERTGKLARDLVEALEGLDAEGPSATAAHLAAIHQGFEQEVWLLESAAVPPGAEEVQTRGTATLELLMELADPHLVDTDVDGRADLAQYLRDQLLAARNEARAAAAALRQPDGACAAHRAGGGIIRLLGRRS
ncbi:MAG TPA: hypothetical protein VII06_07645 [Chloroflexota bacterium]